MEPMTIGKAREIIKQANNPYGKFYKDSFIEAKGFLEGWDARGKEVKMLGEFVFHKDNCILNFWEAGEPTEDGGYRSKYAGKWYKARPIDETPKCNCGLEELLFKLANSK